MAKFRRKGRRFGARKARSYRRSHGGMNPTKLILGGAIYGAGRQSLVNLAQPLTSMLPMGQYADELVLGTAGYFMAKKGRGIFKDAGMAMLAVESASLGAQLAGGLIGGGGNSGGGAF